MERLARLLSRECGSSTDDAPSNMNILLWLLSCLVSAALIGRPATLAAEALDCRRLISLAPSITEVLKVLSLEDSLVGVSRYCTPSRSDLAVLGGLGDTNLEAVYGLQPSLVLLPSEAQPLAASLRALGSNVKTVRQHSIEEIEESIKFIGEWCGKQSLANVILEQFAREKEAIRNSGKKRKSVPRVAVLAASPLANGNSEFYLSGRDGFYSSILELLGAKNVSTAATSALPTASLEGLTVLSPDVIFVINVGEEALRSLKSALSGFLPESQIVALNKPHAMVPGPRYLELVRDMEKVLDERF